MTDEGGSAPVGQRVGPAQIRRTTSLIINVSTLLQEPIGSLRRYEIDGARAAGLDGAVSGALRLLRTDQSILATASLATSVCRCLRQLP